MQAGIIAPTSFRVFRIVPTSVDPPAQWSVSQLFFLRSRSSCCTVSFPCFFNARVSVRPRARSARLRAAPRYTLAFLASTLTVLLSRSTSFSRFCILPAVIDRGSERCFVNQKVRSGISPVSFASTIGTVRTVTAHRVVFSAAILAPPPISLIRAGERPVCLTFPARHSTCCIVAIDFPGSSWFNAGNVTVASRALPSVGIGFRCCCLTFILLFLTNHSTFLQVSLSLLCSFYHQSTGRIRRSSFTGLLQCQNRLCSFPFCMHSS